ncbi:DUF6520 family protein [Edaphocola aurantiacus]|uniref:DUF6520 family protein n=1 Tax=Edaphocola aurantiacus TaxID=2601682 RepID=UPI001C93E334|nr:DUF6520 family protein [Edaphocola aurantiacus]
MKRIVLSTAALMLATAFSFAGTPETKTEAKAKPEVKTEIASQVYHYDSKNSNGTINFLPGEPGQNDCTDGETPCRWVSDAPLTSPMSPAQIESQATVTDYRP